MAISSLDSALSGLKAAQSALSTISNNISNASTEGYTKKNSPQSTLVVAGVAQGVQMDAITRNVNQYLVKALNTQVSANQQAAVTQDYLNRLQDFNGASDSASALSNLIGGLQNAFSSLSSAPQDSNVLNDVLSSAQQVAKKFNDYSGLLTQMRNDAQTQISTDVEAANRQIQTISDLNTQIQQLSAGGQSTADLEDKRDAAVKELSKYLQVTTYTTGNDRLVVMTNLGQPLVDNAPHKLVFNSTTLSAGSYYPGGGANGLFLDSATGTELKQGSIGGELGGLFTLRDTTLPSYQAQLDETAQKLASRLSGEGLNLFTDANGLVPADTAPPAVPAYVGFSAQIKVNGAVTADPSLLRTGTDGETVPAGSNEVINRIVEFAFGDYQSQKSTGTADISSGTLYAALGIAPSARVVGATNLNQYLPGAAGGITLTLNGSSQNIAIGAADTPADLVNNINAAFGATVASLTGNGQLTLSAATDVTVTDNGLGADISDLGLSYTTYPASNPSFSVTVGTNNAPVTVDIAPTDTSTELLAKLNAIPGVTASLVPASPGPGSVLQVAPTNGGSLSLQNVSGTPLAALGLTTSNVAWSSFRTNNLGPGGTLSSGLTANGNIVDYGAAMLGAQALDASNADDAATKESTYLNTLSARNSDQSGVNIDEEMANLIRVQNAYSAAGQVVSTTQKLFDTLLSAFSG
jgi:flagellar hook-associated protein 1 FlgK